jgi:hypothetical protein
MTALTFDTLQYVKKLKAAGVPENQAEIQAETLAGIIEDRLATKKDLKDMEINLRHQMKEIEARLTIRLGGMMAAAIALIAALVKLL